jgi:hypothetical protein
MEEITKPEKEGNKKAIKTDLFRFATLRGPQSITKDRRKLGFVEHPNYAKSALLKEIKADDDLNSIKGKLILAAGNFNPFSSVEEVRQFAGNLWIFSMWLGKNQNNLLNTAELSSNASGVSIPIIEDHLLLWDNVFFDLVTRTNPHVRQACLQLLVAIHFLENYSTNRDPKDYGRIAKSRVIVPTFFTAKISSSEKSAGRGVFQQRSVQVAALDRQAAKTEKLMAEVHVAVLAEMMKEFIDLEIRYRKDYADAYEKALEAHTGTIEERRSKLKQSDQIALNKLAIKTEGGTIDPNQDAINNPFVFTYSKPLSKNYTSRKLSFEARLFIDENRLWESPVATALDRLDRQLMDQKKIAHKALKIVPKNFSIGGLKLKIKSNYIPTYSVTSKIIPTSQGVDLEVYLAFNAGYTNAFFQSSNFQIHIGTTTVQTYAVSPQEIVIIQTTQPEMLFARLKVISFTSAKFDKNALFSVTGGFQLDNDKSYTISSKRTSLYRGIDGVALESTPVSVTDDIIHYGINKIGVADYRKVEQVLCCYIPGEVSQIENIMAREYKEKTTRNLIRSEDTIETTIENEIEELNDTTSTTRFEMNSEISEVLNKDSSANLGFSTGASGEYFGTTFSASMNGDFSTSQSSSKSDTIARTYAEDVTKRALERVVQKNTIKRTTKIIKEFEENNKHGYDNRNSGDHVTGVFRWIDKVYKNQLVNYGKRLVYEFMLPEPARYYKELIVIDVEEGKGNTSQILTEPIHPIDNGIENINSITRNNYQSLCALYGVSAPAPKDETITLSETYGRVVPRNEQANTTSHQFTSPLIIPSDYLCVEIQHDINFHIFREWHTDLHWHITVNAGGTYIFERPPTIGYLNDVHYRSYTNSNPQSTGTITPTVLCRRVDQYNLILKLTCNLKANVLAVWQQEVYDAIMAAYDQQLTTYQQNTAANAVDEAAATEAAILITNPKYNKLFIMNELKRLCIEMMLAPFNLPQGKDFYYNLDLGSDCKGPVAGENKKIPQYTLSPELDNYARQVKFFEQAFDWTILSHVFYPYYWAKKCEWENLFQSRDNVDNVLQEFLQSGMGRVLVPVREGFEDTVVYFMETGEIWHGTGLVLDTDDELYLSIIDETTIIEGKVEDEWETIVPTALTIIQGKSAYLENEGLPCCENKEHSDIKTSKAELGLLPEKK